MMYNFFPMFILIIAPESHSICTSIDRILESFNKVLDYSLGNPDFVELSGIFGVVRAQALIANVLLITNNEQIPNLSISKKKCDDILKLKKKILEPYDEWVRNISDASLWTTKISYKNLRDKCTHLNKNETEQLLNKMRNEAETACIIPQMFEFCLNNLYNGGIFKVHAGCRYFMLGSYQGIGYETTHRLLFLQILKIWQFPNISTQLLRTLCEVIFQQAEATQGNHFFFDLFMEQIFLCGVEGYKEFLNNKWLAIILENQLVEGCFPPFNRKTNLNPSLYKRKCSDHATGLATATLALHLHFELCSKWAQ